MYAANTSILVVFYLVQNLTGNIDDKIDNNNDHLTHIALVLDDPAPVVVVDGVGKLVGDLGDLVPLDVFEEGKELSLGDRIEREQTSFSVLSGQTWERSRRNSLELTTQLYSLS